MRALERLAGQVVLVAGGGTGLGRDLALALAARGVRVVVTGKEERALGETVGEIACGGGKARHIVGDVQSAAHLQGAMKKATDAFGALDAVVVGSRGATIAIAESLAGPFRLLVLVRPPTEACDAVDPEWPVDDGDDMDSLVARLQAREISCHAIRARLPAELVERALLLLAEERA